MTVQPMASQTGSGGTSASAQNPSPDNVTENEFLQLLVAQIRYQDPTNPADSTAFVTQLAQFSSLEQLVAIRTDLDTQTGSAGTKQGGH